MAKRSYRYFVGDFETTVYKGQVNTEVWASAAVELFNEDVKIFHSIDETFDYFCSLKTNIICYYHNLKFDGSFWLSYLLTEKGYQQALEYNSDSEYDCQWISAWKMPSGSFRYSISNRGQWYTITIKVGKFIIEFRDSLKLLPFSVKRIGKSFKTKHQKLDMEYTGLRYAGCTITPEEQKYIANDVLVVKEALEIMFTEEHNKLTIGSCCLDEFTKLTGKEEYEYYFPDVYDIPIDPEQHKQSTAGDWIKKSYRGGWCYLARGKENKVFTNGTTADVNSLYPSVMSSESGNRYPVGKPQFWTGEPPKWIYTDDKIFYFIRLRTRFKIKEGMLPFIQIKGNLLYRGNEMLETSDIYDPKTKQYYDHYYDLDGNLVPATVELTLTMMDYHLLLEHYDLSDTEYIDGCWFATEIGLFDRYMEKYKKIKMESKGAMRELAKLFLNNLYGKMASSTDSSFKVAYVKEDKSLGFIEIEEHNKKAGYIPIGSAITSYARNFTIRAAQLNYHGKDKRGFIYADTDSIHCDLTPEEIKGINVHPTNFCCWKLESCWDKGIFARQKTYIEHITHEDCEPIDEPFYNVKCAGMPDACKELLINSITQTKTRKEYTEEEEQFINQKRELTDFKVGLSIPTGRLKPKRIMGGILLVDGPYEMR